MNEEIREFAEELQDFLKKDINCSIKWGREWAKEAAIRDMVKILDKAWARIWAKVVTAKMSDNGSGIISADRDLIPGLCKQVHLEGWKHPSLNIK